MNITSAMPTTTRGVFSKNIVIAYLPCVADGFNVSIIHQRTWREMGDHDRLHEVTSLNRLVGISSKHDRLIIVEGIF